MWAVLAAATASGSCGWLCPSFGESVNRRSLSCGHMRSALRARSFFAATASRQGGSGVVPEFRVDRGQGSGGLDVMARRSRLVLA